jgi:CRP-like cAMP-binding protein
MTPKNGHSIKPGERTNAEGKAVRNILLLSIPNSEYLLLRDHLQFVELRFRASLHEPNQQIGFVYFQNGGVVSIVVAMADGNTVEAGIVGLEGVVGLPWAVGLNRSPHRAVVQIAGDGFQVEVDTLRRILTSAPQLQNILSRCAVIRGMQVAQTAACNRLHDIEQRLARWLLMSQDRVDSEWLPITHDFLATMLGTGRSSVSLAAASLQAKGVIEYLRGAVRILNRKGLESSACECYGAIQQFNGELGLK